MTPIEGGAIYGPPGGWYKLTFYAAQDTNQWGENTKGLVYYALQRTPQPDPLTVLVPERVPEPYREHIRLPAFDLGLTTLQPAFAQTLQTATTVVAFGGASALVGWSVATVLASYGVA
jgi:hypothetical protein